MARRGRKYVAIPCAHCGHLSLRRITSRRDGNGGQIRIYECSDCPRGKNTITREAWWGDGKYGMRYFAEEESHRTAVYNPE